MISRHLDTDEFIVAEALLIRKELKLSEIQQLLDSSHVYPVIKRLIEKKVCFVRESLKETYSPKKDRLRPTQPGVCRRRAAGRAAEQLGPRAKTAGAPAGVSSSAEDRR